MRSPAARLAGSAAMIEGTRRGRRWTRWTSCELSPNGGWPRWRCGRRWPIARRWRPWWRASTWWSSAEARPTRSSTAGACIGARCWPTAGSTGDNLLCGLHGWDYRIDTGVSAYNNAEALDRFTSWLDGDRPVRGCQRGGRLQDAPPPALRPRRLPGLLPRSPHGARGAVRGLHPRAGGQRPDQDRPPRSGVGHGRAPRRAAQLGRHPVRHRPAGHVCRCSTTWRSAPRCASGRTPIKPAVARHPDLRVGHELRSAVAGSEDGAGQRGRAGRHRHLLGGGRHAARGAGRANAATSTSWPRPDSAGPSTTWPRCRPSTSRAARGPRPVPAATCPATRWWAASPRSAACPKAPRRCRRPRFPTGTRSTTSAGSPIRCARAPAASPSASSCRPSTSSDDLDAALAVGVDYVILDGRGGGTGAAPLIFRDNISVPTIPALARARAPPRPRWADAT